MLRHHHLHVPAQPLHLATDVLTDHAHGAQQQDAPYHFVVVTQAVVVPVAIKLLIAGAQRMTLMQVAHIVDVAEHESLPGCKFSKWLP